LRHTIKQVASWIASHELWFLILAAPFMLFPFGPWPFVALGFVALTWLCRWIASGRLTVSSGVDIPIIIIVLMALVGYSISVDPALSETRLWSLILGVVVFYGIVNSLNSDKQIWAAASILAILTVGIAGISLLGTDWQQTRLINAPWIYDRLPTLIRGLPNSGVPRPSDLIHPRFVGITMGVFVAVFLALLFFSRNRNLRILSFVVIFIGFGTLLLTQTLAGLAGLLIAILFLVIWRNRLFILVIPFGLATVISGLLLLDPTRVIQFLLSIENSAGIAVALRLDMWSRALAMIRDMPYTGIGLNTFPVIQSNFYPGFLLGPEPHAHNLLIQTSIDLGLPGLVAFFWLIITWMFIVGKKYHARSNPEHRILLVGLIAGILSYIAAGSIDAMMLGSKPGVVFWILLGIGAAPMRSQYSLEPATSKRPIKLINTIIPLILFVGIFVVFILLNPASFYMNLGAIQVHQALYPTPSPLIQDNPDIDKAKATLSKVLVLDRGYQSAYELLGRIYALEGSNSQAVDAFAHRVLLDGKNPLLHYFPSDYWLEQLQNTDSTDGENWSDLVQVYQHWIDRFPTRAEVYLEMSLLWQCYLSEPVRAEGVLRLGIEKQAQPVELLEYYQSLLSRGDISMCFVKK
jgi:putative inorganic carbon (HCO3(-)) transporter